MENSGVALFIGGIIVTIFLVMGGMFNLRRHDMKAMKSIDEMTATGTRVWSYLTPNQQDELKSIESLLVQEEWIEQNVEQSVLNGVSAERILIEFANRGFILLGQGVFRRHSSPLDFIEPKAQIIEVSGPETISEDAEVKDVEEESPKVEPIVIVSGDVCSQCKQLLPSEPTEIPKEETPKIQD
jgi:predicted transcriptional regulator